MSAKQSFCVWTVTGDALLRNARFIVGIKLHTGTMTIEQAEEFFQKEGYQSKERPLWRPSVGAGDPTYLYYTLGQAGNHEAARRHEDEQGAAFSLENFTRFS